MASHKVPQDVESEDKLLGPLSLKQLLFTMAGIFFGWLVYFFFAKIHPVTSVIWLPFMIFFLVLGLYQRKDQPVEVFLAAAIKYYFGNRTKIWNQEAYQERIIITVPPKIEHVYTKNFSGQEAVRRLDSLSSMMDSRGWSGKVQDWQNPQLVASANSTRLIPTPQPQAAPQPSFTQPIDVQDHSTSLVARTIDQQLTQSTTTGRQHAIQALQSAKSQADNTNFSTTPPTYQQYPPSIHQKVVEPDPLNRAEQAPKSIPGQNVSPEAVMPKQRVEPESTIQTDSVHSGETGTQTLNDGPFSQPTLSIQDEVRLPRTLDNNSMLEGQTVEISLHDD